MDENLSFSELGLSFEGEKWGEKQKGEKKCEREGENGEKNVVNNKRLIGENSGRYSRKNFKLFVYYERQRRRLRNKNK